MDELLRKKQKSDVESEQSGDKSENASDGGSEVGDVKPAVPESPKVKPGRKLSVNARFEVISSQVSTLAAAVSKLVLSNTPTVDEKNRYEGR